jgi:hypothetical protein
MLGVIPLVAAPCDARSIPPLWATLQAMMPPTTTREHYPGCCGHLVSLSLLTWL